MTRLAEIREREGKATKDWTLDEVWPGILSRRTMLYTGNQPSDFVQFRDEENALFCFEARKDIPYLLERLEAAEKVLRGCAEWPADEDDCIKAHNYFLEWSD